MKKFILFSLLIFFSMFAGEAQTITVLDKSEMTPIGGVVIQNSAQSKTVVTNAEGKADISVFVPADTLQFSHLSFQTTKVSFQQAVKVGRIYLLDRVVNLIEVVFSASRSEELTGDIPARMDVIGRKEVRFENPQNSAVMLQQSGKVFVQQSQMGGGSPVIRGFEANRVLIVVDGVRLNNTIYRSGHLQNVITIDPNALDRTEIIYGPGSVLYGSDALGGVMNFITLDPVLSGDKKFLFRGSAFGRFSSADLEKTGNIVLNFGLKKVGFLTSFTFSDFGDLREGRIYQEKYGDWGKRPWYQETFNKCDSTVVNDKDWIQRFTGYRQYDVLQKIVYLPDRYNKITFNFQFSNTGNIPRYDRLTELRNGKPRYAEWYYGPQTRLLTILKYDYSKPNKAMDHMTLTAAYQQISETRVTRDYTANKPTNKLQKHQDEMIYVGSLNADLYKNLTKKNKLSYGIEASYNYVSSQAYNFNIVTSATTYNGISRYPDNGISQIAASAYVLHHWVINPKLIFNQGIRYNQIWLNSNYSDTMMVMLGNPPIQKENRMNNWALCGSLGLVGKPGFGWELALNLSSGFKAPNADDVFKYNDSKPGSQLVVPNPGLKPEYAYSADLTVSKTFLDRVQLSVTGFYTYIVNAIKMTNYPYNGSDSTLWDGTMVVTKSNVNVNNAYIYGVQADLSVQFFRFLSLQSTMTYTFGRDNENKPLSHIPPMFGKTSLVFEMKRLKAEFYSLYNFNKRLEDYDMEGEDNIQVAPLSADGGLLGMPGWYTLNLKLSVNINKYVQLQVGAENLMDLHYRTFASGVSAPGRNIYGAIKLNYQ